MEANSLYDFYEDPLDNQGNANGFAGYNVNNFPIGGDENPSTIDPMTFKGNQKDQSQVANIKDPSESAAYKNLLHLARNPVLQFNNATVSGLKSGFGGVKKIDASEVGTDKDQPYQSSIISKMFETGGAPSADQNTMKSGDIGYEQQSYNNIQDQYNSLNMQAEKNEMPMMPHTFVSNDFDSGFGAQSISNNIVDAYKKSIPQGNFREYQNAIAPVYDQEVVMRSRAPMPIHQSRNKQNILSLNGTRTRPLHEQMDVREVLSGNVHGTIPTGLIQSTAEFQALINDMGYTKDGFLKFDQGKHGTKGGMNRMVEQKAANIPTGFYNSYQTGNDSGQVNLYR